MSSRTSIEWFNLTANPKAVKSLAGCVRFRDGGLAATIAATFDPAQKSPLFEFLSGPGVKLEQLHHAHRPATFALGVDLPEKNRAEAVIGFLDAIAKSSGELGRLPRDIVKELGAKHKMDVAESLIGKVQTVTVIMPSKQDLPKGGKPGPMLVFQTDRCDRGRRWEEFLPKLVGELAGAAVAAATIDGDHQRREGLHGGGGGIAVECTGPFRAGGSGRGGRSGSQARRGSRGGRMRPTSVAGGNQVDLSARRTGSTLRRGFARGSSSRALRAAARQRSSRSSHRPARDPSRVS